MYPQEIFFESEVFENLKYQSFFLKDEVDGPLPTDEAGGEETTQPPEETPAAEGVTQDD